MGGGGKGSLVAGSAADRPAVGGVAGTTWPKAPRGHARGIGRWPGTATAMAAFLLGLTVLASLGTTQPRGNPRQGEVLYREKCVLCHGNRGEGWDWTAKVPKPPVPVPDLAQVVRERSDDYLFSIVRDGGEAVGRTRFMPGFGFQMSDEEVWDLIAYLRLLSGRARQ